MLLRNLKGWGLALLGICYITGVFPYIHGLSVTAMFFFCFGAYFSIHRQNIVERLRPLRIVSLALYLPLTAVMVYYNGQYTMIGQFLYPFYIALSVIALINLTAWMLEQGYRLECPTLSRATFFIYAFHGFMALTITNMVLIRIIPYSETHWVGMLVRYLLTAPVAIAVCLIVQYIMRRFCPRVLNVLTGSRK